MIKTRFSLVSGTTYYRLSFLATFVPLLFLVNQCWSLSLRSRRGMRAYYHSYFITMKNMTTQSVSSLSTSSNTRIIQQRLRPISTISWVLSNQKINTKLKCFDYVKHKNTKKSFISCIALIIMLYGIIILSLVVTHFDTAISFCNQVVADSSRFIGNTSETFMQVDRPELFLWD